MLAIEDDVPSKLLDSPVDLEAVAVEIYTSSPLVIILAYAPPSMQFLQCSSQLDE